MKIQIQKNDSGMEHIGLEGELDFHSASDLRSELAKAAERRAAKILIDLQKVNYVDSSGLAVFVELFQKMNRYGGKLVLFNLTPSVRGVFEISKLDSIFQLAADEKEALSRLS